MRSAGHVEYMENMKKCVQSFIANPEVKNRVEDLGVDERIT
jgi:hypothetical protein